MTRNSGYTKCMEALPLCSAEELVGQRDVLVIAPHPDDESLGCGGLLAWAVSMGRRARVLFLTDGDQSHPGSIRFPKERLAALRRQEAVAACRALGLYPIDLTFLGLPDAGLASLNESVELEAIDTLVQWIECSHEAVVLVTADTDSHSDHQSACAWAKVATKRNANVRLWAYPIWTWLQDNSLNGRPRGRRVELGAFRDAKRAAINAHASQHGTLVDDAKENFVIPQKLLQRMTQDYEVFLYVDL